VNGTGTAPAPILALTRREALRVLNRMPFLVCMSGNRLAIGAVYRTRLEVSEYGRLYKFAEQPFLIMRAISREEFKNAAPWAHGGTGKMYYYEVHTD